MRGELYLYSNALTYLTIRLCSIFTKIVLKGGSGGPPPEFFYKISYKIRQFQAFPDTSNDIYQCCHNKRVDGIYVICII